MSEFEKNVFKLLVMLPKESRIKIINKLYELIIEEGDKLCLTWLREVMEDTE